MKIRMIIRGCKVHGVGYRPWLTDVAMNSGLIGFSAINRMEESRTVVVVLAEGDEESISYFEALVRSDRPPFAQVDSIAVDGFTGSVIALEKYAAINTSAQLNKAIPLLLGMNNKMDQMLDKQDQMLDKQDQMLDKQEEMLNLQRETVVEIRELRDDVVVHSSTGRLVRMEKDIRAIKAKIGIM